MKFKVEYTENSEYRHVIVYRENEFSFDTVQGRKQNLRLF